MAMTDLYLRAIQGDMKDELDGLDSEGVDSNLALRTSVITAIALLEIAQRLKELENIG